MVSLCKAAHLELGMSGNRDVKIWWCGYAGHLTRRYSSINGSVPHFVDDCLVHAGPSAECQAVTSLCQFCQSLLFVLWQLATECKESAPFTVSGVVLCSLKLILAFLITCSCQVKCDGRGKWLYRADYLQRFFSGACKPAVVFGVCLTIKTK